MKTWKLVSGIISIVLSSLTLLQSCTVGCFGSVANDNEALTNSAIGYIVAVLMLVGGIVSISTMRKEGKSLKDSNIAIAVIFGIAVIFAFSGEEDYSDLYLYGTWSLACAVVAIALIISQRFRSSADNKNYNTETDYSQNSDFNSGMWIDCLDDSMEPEIPNGTKLIVNKTSVLTNGEIALILINGNQKLIRKVIYGNNWIELRPINMAYPILRFEGENVGSIRIVGTVQKV